MKQAKEYVKSWSLYDRIPTRELEAIIKQAQIDAVIEVTRRFGAVGLITDYAWHAVVAQVKGELELNI